MLIFLLLLLLLLLPLHYRVMMIVAIEAATIKLYKCSVYNYCNLNFFISAVNLFLILSLNIFMSLLVGNGR